MELGIELSKSLGEAAHHDLLANWMAHHLAEKLALERTARGPSKKQLSHECADLILKLWAHRHSLPDGVRPLESFEPIFRALQALRADQPRSSYLHAVPPETKAPKEIKNALAAARAIDGGASTVIRYLLAEAVGMISPQDRRWSKLRAAIAPSHWDIRVIIELIDEAKNLVDENEKLKVEAVKELEEMIARVRALRDVARTLEDQFVSRLAAVRNP